MIAAWTEVQNKNERKAQSAFDRISASVRDQLTKHLRVHHPAISSDHRDDIVQETLLDLWYARDKYVFETYGKLISCLRRIAENKCIDFYRKRIPILLSQLALYDGAEPDIPAHINIEAEAIARSLFKQLMFAADVEWLGVSVDCTPQEARMKLLAAKCYFEDEMCIADIADILKFQSEESCTAISSLTIEGWLKDPSCLKQYVYDSLYIVGRNLLNSLLPHNFKDAESVIKFWESLVYSNDLGAAQIKPFAAVSRYYFDRPVAKTLEIMQLRYPAFSRQQLEELLIALSDSLPYKPLATKIKLRFAESSELQLTDPALNRSDTWSRLIFQYWYIQDLERKDILERTVAPAGIFSFNLTESTFNSLTSGYRLRTALIRRWQLIYDRGREQAVA